MGQANNKLKWCINKAKDEGEKHRGIMLIKPDSAQADKHIAKAKHNLKTMLLLMKGNSLDWAINASFYTMYHCCLAILAKFGYESRNQECTFAAIEALIFDKKIDLPIEKLRRISVPDRADTVDSTEVIELREDAQYGTGTAFDMNQVETLRAETVEFLAMAQKILEETP